MMPSASSAAGGKLSPCASKRGAVGLMRASRARSSASAPGEAMLLKAIEALQGVRYLRLAESRPANEAFLYGWLANRIG